MRRRASIALRLLAAAALWARTLLRNACLLAMAALRLRMQAFLRAAQHLRARALQARILRMRAALMAAMRRRQAMILARRLRLR